MDHSNDTNTAFVNMISWYNDNCKTTYHINNLTCKVSREITVMLSRLHKGFNIVDGGADTHVVGNTWKPLQPIDSHTPRADVIGFDSNAARKKGLPIGAYVTKTITSDGKEVILKAKHAVGNDSSSHTLLCTYQMREMGIIVDDVSKHHLSNIHGDKGTQSINFNDGTIIPLKCRHTLMVFITTIPTEQEIATLPTYDIAMENWNPQMYYDGMNDDLSIMSFPDSGGNQISAVNQLLFEDTHDDITIELPPTILDYIDYNHSDSSESLSYNSSEQIFNSFFSNIDVDAVFGEPYTVDPYDEDADDKTKRFYEVKSYYENMNYWHDDDQDLWYDSLSSGEPNNDINDHLDTKDFNKKPTKDINDQTDTKEPPEDKEYDILHNVKQTNKPFHLTIDHQTIRNRERGGNIKSCILHR